MNRALSDFALPYCVTPESQALFQDRSGGRCSTEQILHIMRLLYEAHDPEPGECWHPSAEIEAAVDTLAPANAKKALTCIVHALRRQANPRGLSGPDRWVLRLLRWFGTDESLQSIDQSMRYVAASNEPLVQPDEKSFVLKILLGSPECDPWLALFKLLHEPWAQPGTGDSALRVELEHIAKQRSFDASDPSAPSDPSDPSEPIDVMTAFEALVPRLGFDRGGTRTHVDSDRSVTVAIIAPGDVSLRDGQGRPWVKPEGKKKSDLAEKALAARVKQSVRDVDRLCRVMSPYLERAMLRRRTWSRRAWAHVFQEHPLWAAFARSLVWRCADGQTFRADDSGGLTGPDDQPVTIDQEKILLAHPIDLSVDELARWRAQLADYKLIQPLAQIDRPHARVGDDIVRAVQGCSTRLDRDALQNIGWWPRGATQGHQVFAHTLPAEGVTARAIFAQADGGPPQRWSLERVELVEHGDHSGHNTLSMNRLDPLTHSEIWGHLIGTIRSS